MTSANPQQARSAGIGRAWRGFRRWRRTRPFWGGLFTALAGLEILGTTKMSLNGLTFSSGPQGFLAWLVPVILVTCGMLLWFSPQQRLFYSVVAAVTTVFSLIGVNLGGFFIGLLLGMVGSSLGFAWGPAAPPSTSEAATEPVDDEPVPADAAATVPQQRDGGPEAVPGAPRSHDPRFLGVALVALSLSTGGLLAVANPSPVRAAPRCPSTASASPSASPSARPHASASASPSASPSPTPSDGNLLTDILHGIGDLLTGAGGDPSATPSATPTASPDAPPSGSPTPSGRPTATPRTASGPCPAPKPAPSRSGEVAAGRPLPRIAAEPGQPRVAAQPSKLTGSKVTMTGLRFDGIVELPTATGNLRALKFSMKKAVTDDFVLQADGPGNKTARYVTDQLTVKGDVAFYATRFVGRLLGLKITLTPDLPFPDGIPITSPIPITFTDPVIDLAYVDSDTLTGKPTLTLDLA
ncbi:hypothetical protein DLE60_06050 [Micromonospora globispora]|uniref:Uncharacterized protein n=1 Tax=Micromonospora globispora TaxID=1450148 RepID=A0A317JX22_9ACTN|nr:DUF6114 domain-containing protein [Micromonospora globispora]PWU45289.1 hypothetical protein DLJ46_21965 [Micromonospora globispora]PWU61368.1 hypothetical protein DLE60_06050 [Micromonospora globispora]